MTLAYEHPNPIAVLDAVIAYMRASGDTGHVENLLQARADFEQHSAFLKRVSLGPAASCGCKPVCQCLSESSLRIWSEEIAYEAEEILTKTGATQ